MECNVKVEISPPAKTKTDLDGMLKMSIRMNYLKRNKLHYNILSSNCDKGRLEATVVGRPVFKYLIMVITIELKLYEITQKQLSTST